MPRGIDVIHALGSTDVVFVPGFCEFWRDKFLHLSSPLIAQVATTMMVFIVQGLLPPYALTGQLRNISTGETGIEGANNN